MVPAVLRPFRSQELRIILAVCLLSSKGTSSTVLQREAMLPKRAYTLLWKAGLKSNNESRIVIARKIREIPRDDDELKEYLAERKRARVLAMLREEYLTETGAARELF